LVLKKQNKTKQKPISDLLQATPWTILAEIIPFLATPIHCLNQELANYCAYFCIIGTQPHPLVYILPGAAFQLQRQRPTGPQNPKRFTLTFQESLLTLGLLARIMPCILTYFRAVHCASDKPEG